LPDPVLITPGFGVYGSSERLGNHCIVQSLRFST
jgi:hypothetical protein